MAGSCKAGKGTLSQSARASSIVVLKQSFWVVSVSEALAGVCKAIYHLKLQAASATSGLQPSAPCGTSELLGETVLQPHQVLILVIPACQDGTLGLRSFGT